MNESRTRIYCLHRHQRQRHALVLARNWSIYVGDISTAFMHAPVAQGEEIFVEPPPEFYPNGETIWKLKKAMYGLRSSPASWQAYFSAVAEKFGFRRFWSEPNCYMFKDVVLLIYVDDILMLGNEISIR